jgi:hypothetical protein
MNHSDILEKIANIYTLRNNNSRYNNLFVVIVVLFLFGYLHFMFRKISNNHQFIIKQNDDIYSLILKKCIADNKYMSKPLLWT